MSLISTQDLITLVLHSLQELDGLTEGSPHWSRDQVLQRMNLQQSKISTELPELFTHVDVSLTTDGTSRAFAIPSTMGNIRDVSIGGNPCTWTSRSELTAMSLRGDIEENWEDAVGNVTPLYTFYCWVEIDDSTGTLQPMLYTYPMVANVGQTIKLTGELLLANAADSPMSFPFQSVAYLEKAQELLVKLTAQWFALDDGRTELYQALEQECFGGTGSTNSRGLMGRLQAQYNVLRAAPRPPMITYKMSEDSAGSNYFKWSRTTLPGA